MSSLTRKEELERKKAKLAAMREERLHRDSNKYLGGSALNVPPMPVINNVDMEGILGDLGIGAGGAILGRVKLDDASKSASTPSLSSKLKSRPVPTLTLSELQESSFEPTEDEKYSKDTQTMGILHCETPSIATDTWPETPSIAHGNVSKGVVSLEWDDDLLEEDEGDPPTEHEAPPLPNHLEMDRNVHIKDHGAQPLKELTEEDKENIMRGGDFQDFFERASQLVEDALEDDRDIFMDYSGADKEDELAKALRMLTEERVFFDETWTSGRTVTALDWSSSHPDLLLAAYSPQVEDEIGLALCPHSAPDGVCCLWSLRAAKKSCADSATAATTPPDAVFTCQAPITAAILPDFHPNLVIAGTYVGHIVLWDMRVNRQTPVQRTAIAGGTGHCEPIKELAVTGNPTANNLVSVSSDGRLCVWSLDMLAKPIQTTELAYKQVKTVVPTSLAFARDFDDSFLIGAQDGSIYAGSRGGSETGVTDVCEGHSAPVTSTTIPSAYDPLNDASIFLTTSMDCTVKLWTKQKRFPLISFEDRSEYFLDCDWSPCHPALFATVDLGGHLDIWNLNMNTEVPTTTTLLSGDVMPNRCKFQKKGSHVAVGDDSGKARVFVVNDKIAMPRPDEWTIFEGLVQRLTATAAEQQKSDSFMRDFVFSDM